VVVGCSFLLFGCGAKPDESSDSGQINLEQVSCIGVLPAASIGEGEVAPVYIPDEEGFRQGIQVMNEILSQELGGKDKVRFAGLDQLEGLQLTGGESPLALARMVGQRVGCNAVLETTVRRYSERVGGRYSVESPAAVAFEMRLISLDSGSILWSAQFDETQKSVMENLLEWKKANTRKFTWITAEELMREGVRGKLADCLYFNPPGE